MDGTAALELLVSGFFDAVLMESANNALSAIAGPFSQGVALFLKWARRAVSAFLLCRLQKLPVFGTMAERLSLVVTDYLFIVVDTLIADLRAIVADRSMWHLAHYAAKKAWDDAAARGALAQAYAYGRKMAAYFLEVVHLAVVRAIFTQNESLSEDERREVTDILNETLGTDPDLQPEALGDDSKLPSLD